MTRSMKNNRCAAFLMVLTVLLVGTAAWAGGPVGTEVAKGKIPAQYLDPALKQLPGGITIWDVDEAVEALKNKNGKYLWVDTRPRSLIWLGTVKNAVQLVWDQDGKAVPEDEQGPQLTRESLLKAIKQIDADINEVTVAFFCQGPK